MSRREADDSFSGGEYGAIKSMSLQACCREGKWPEGILHLEYGVWGENSAEEMVSSVRFHISRRKQDGKS